jgi:hypothetical protein
MSEPLHSNREPKPRRTGRRSVTITSAWIIGGLGAVGAIIAAVIVTHSPTVTVNVGTSNSPAAGSESPSGSAASSRPVSISASGAISQPTVGFAVASKTFLHASGTAEGIPANSRLWLFIQWQGVRKYWASDPRNFKLERGRWSGRIYVGDPGHLTLWLVFLGPNSLKALNKDVYYQNNGFPTMILASDAKVLASVPFISQ